jgi:nickel-dependent lactate racemase
LTLVAHERYDFHETSVFPLISPADFAKTIPRMQTSVPYGRAAQFDLQLPQTAVLLDRRRPVGEPLDDVPAATAAALAAPLEFPPLRQAITPDDHVAIAVGPGVPQAAAVVAGVVHALCDAGIDPLNIVVVQTADDGERDIAAELGDELRTCVRTFTHHAEQREELCYLAADDDDQAIYFSRQLCDADLVIPVGCLHGAGGLGYTGVSAALYPAFADAAAQRRFHVPSGPGDASHAQHERESEAANWQLGVLLTVQIVPGSGESVLQVLAGERHAVERRGQAICNEAWGFAAPQRAQLVVATVEGAAEQQTWDSFARALHAASHAVSEDGAIAVCTELATRPGPALQKLAGDLGSDAAIRKIRRENSADALAAAELWRVLTEHRVYLLSQLDADVVESLGMAYVAEGREIARLCTRHASCSILGNAQHAVPRESS